MELSFRLSDTESERYQSFSDKHKKCRIKEGKKTPSGFPIGTPEITFKPTGIGDIVEVRCPICGKTADITDFENW